MKSTIVYVESYGQTVVKTWMLRLLVNRAIIVGQPWVTLVPRLWVTCVLTYGSLIWSLGCGVWGHLFGHLCDLIGIITIPPFLYCVGVREGLLHRSMTIRVAKNEYVRFKESRHSRLRQIYTSDCC